MSLDDKLDNLTEKLSDFRVDMSGRMAAIETKVEGLDEKMEKLEKKFDPFKNPKLIGIILLLFVLAGAALGERAWNYADRFATPAFADVAAEQTK